MFKTIELGAWYRIRWAGKNVFGKALERHRNSYTFRFADEKGKAHTAQVNRSDIFGRLGDHLIPELESAIAAPRRRTSEPKAKTNSPKNRSTADKSRQEQPVTESLAKMHRSSKASTVRKKRKPSKGQRLLFPDL